MSELITHHKRKHESSYDHPTAKRPNRIRNRIRNRKRNRPPDKTPDKTPDRTPDNPPKEIITKELPDKDNVDNIDKTIARFLSLFTDPGGADPLAPEPITDNMLICCNPLCDHDSESTNFQIVEMDKIVSAHDLICLGKSFHCKKNLVYKGINLRLLCNIVEPLTELCNLVGLANVKNRIVDQIMFFLRGYHVKERCNKCVDCSFNLPCTNNRTDMLHTVITGPPGVGKTQVARIIGKIYCNMGILSKGTFTEVGREDLIAKYLGQTAVMTKQKILDCTGGVMFIDEVYALGNKEKRDSFSKECIDTLNRSLSNITDLLCIVAGYEKDIDECFFSYNAGLRRRFTFSYDIEGYTPSELYEIFCLKVKNDCWELNLNGHEVARLKYLFRDKYSYFPSFGGDMETLFLQCKICHSRNTNVNNCANTRELYINDIQDGFKNFISNRKYNDASSVGVFTG